MLIPAQHVEIIFEVCHLSPAEKAAFLEAYHQAHPRRLAGKDHAPHTRTITVTVPDLGDARKNRALEQTIADLAAPAGAVRGGRRLRRREGRRRAATTERSEGETP